MFYAVLATGTLVVVVVFAAYNYGVFQRHSPYVDEKISGPLTVSAEWEEIRPKNPLKRTGDHQEVGLYVAEPFSVVVESPRSYGVRMPDGSLVTPEVQVIDAEGNTITLKFSSARGKKTMTYRLPDNRLEYRAVRLRAERQIRLDAVYWSGIIIKNMP